ncbi:uncharacterized protein FYW61_018724 [Anableps anableps]
MANTTTTRASYIQADPQADECRENVPPRDPKAVDSSKLENAAPNATERFTSQIGEDDMNVFDTRVFSTPAPKNKTSESQVKSRLSGVPSALTPILKQHLNIRNKSSSQEPFQHQNSSNLTVPFSYLAANCQKSTGDFRRLITGEDFSMINDECLPEVTLSDLSADSMMHLTMNDSVLPESLKTSPQLYGKKTHTPTNTRGHQNSFPTKADESFESTLSFQGTINDYLREITLLDVTRDSELSPVGQMTSTDITPVVSPAGHLEVSRAASDHGEQIMTELGKSDTITIEELSGTSVNSAHCSRQSTIKASSEVTQDVTLENSKSSFETSGQKVEKSQNSDDSTGVINVTRDLYTSCDTSAKSADISSSGMESSTPEVYSEPREKPDSVDALSDEMNAKVTRRESQRSPESETSRQKVERSQNSDTLCTQAINITQEINTCCDMSAQTAHLSSSHIDKSTSELESEPKEKPDSADTKTEELPTSCDTTSTNKESQQSLKSDVSTNGTFTVEQPSMASAPPDTAPVSTLNNETLGLPTADVSNPKVVNESRDQQSSVDTETGASFVVNRSSSDKKETPDSMGQNDTVDRHSLQKSKLQIGSAVEETPAPLGHRNDTFDCKLPSQQNGTMTLSEMSSSDSHQSGLGVSSAPKASNSTTTLKDGCSENQSPKLQRNAAAQPEAKKDGSPNRTFEANPALEAANGSKDLSQSGLCDLSNHQSSDTETIKAHSFNLDETLDLRAECLTTSTPMPSCKVSNFDMKREAGHVLAVQKNLYGQPPNEPSSTMASNILGDRKTFFKQPAAKQLYPPSKIATHLMKRNPPAAATGLPVKKPRTDREAVKSAAAPKEQQEKTSVSSSYNLRSLASKLPTSGLQRPQLNGIPVGFPRAPLGLRTRVNAAASSSSEKLSGPTAANPVTKITQGKKHLLTKGDALPVSKRKKTDAPLPSSSSEAPASACNPTNGVKTLKQPITSQRSALDKASRSDAAVPASSAKTVTSCDAISRGRSLKPPVTNQRAHLIKPQSQGCTKCSVLEEKIRLQSEEIQRLKEELLKYQNPVDC